MGRSAHCRRGFSLTELIVTIGIVAALIALLMPALARARKASQSTNCKARLQQLGAAFQMYLNENRTRYPEAPTLPSMNPNNYPTIPQYLSHYVGDLNQAFACPADDYVYPVEGISYYYYNELGEVPLSQTFFWQVFQNASQVPVLWDTTVFHGTAADNNWLFIDGHVEDHFVAPVPSP